MPLDEETLAILNGGAPSAAHIKAYDGSLAPETLAILNGEETKEPGAFSSPLRAFETVTAPLGYAKRGVDALARAGARAQGINVPDTATVGWMAREAAGLDPADNGNDTVSARLRGKALEFGTDVALDPLTWALGGAGKIAKAGEVAEAFIGPAASAAKAAEVAATIKAGERAAQVGRGAAAAFAPGMLTGAYHEGSSAIDKYRRDGLTPDVAELALGAGLSGGMGLLSGLHAAGAHPIQGLKGQGYFGEPDALPLRDFNEQAAAAPEVSPDTVPEAPAGLRRPSFLDEGPQAEPVPPGPALGYGRGGIPVHGPGVELPEGQALEESIQRALQAPPGPPRINDYQSPESLGLRPLEDVVGENVSRRMRKQGVADQQALDALARPSIEDRFAETEGPTDASILEKLADAGPPATSEDALAQSAVESVGTIPAPRLGPKPAPVPGLGQDFTLSPRAQEVLGVESGDGSQARQVAPAGPETLQSVPASPTVESRTGPVRSPEAVAELARPDVPRTEPGTPLPGLRAGEPGPTPTPPAESGVVEPGAPVPSAEPEARAGAPAPADVEPTYAYRARNAGQKGIPSDQNEHAHATMSESQAWHLAPSRTEAPQEMVRVDVSKLSPADYELKRHPDGMDWVKFKRPISESEVDKVEPVTAIDRTASEKAPPAVVQDVQARPVEELAMRAGLSEEAATKGVADVMADGQREIRSPEATAVKRAALQAMMEEHAAGGEPTTHFEAILNEIDQAERTGVQLGHTDVVARSEDGKVIDRFQGENLHLSDEAKQMGVQPLAVDAAAGRDGTPGIKGPELEGQAAAGGPTAEPAGDRPPVQLGEPPPPSVPKFATKPAAPTFFSQLQKTIDEKRTPEMRRSVVEEGQPLFKTASGEAAGLPTRDLVAKRFGPHAKVTEQDGAIRLQFPDGRGDVWIRGVDKIEATGADAEALRQAHPDSAGAQILGSTRSIGRDALIDVLEGRTDLGTLGHEEGHALLKLGRLRPNEIDALFKEHGWEPGQDEAARAQAEERVMDTVGQWIKEAADKPASIEGRPSWFRRAIAYWQRMVSAFKEGLRGTDVGRVRERITSGDVYKPEGALERVARGAGEALGGEAFGRETGPEVASETPKYATAPATPPDVSGLMKKEERPGPKLVEKPVPESLGRPMEPGEAPRVETKVDALREVAPGAKLSRDAPRSWQSLDPAIKGMLADLTSGTKKEQDALDAGTLTRGDLETSIAKREAAFWERIGSGRVNDVDMQVSDALVRGKAETADALRAKYVEASSKGEAPKESLAYIKAALDAVVGDYAKALRSDVEAGSKIARAMAARARIMAAQISATHPDAFLRKIFREIPDISDRDAGALVEILKTDPSKLQDALHASLNPKMSGKVLELWKSGLVSAPGTQVANLLGNMGEQVMRVGETALASLIDPLFGGKRSRLTGEARYELAGSLKGAVRGIGDLGRSLKDIATLAPEKIDLSRPLEYQTGQIGGKTGRAVRTPFRLLSAFDDYFKTIAGDAELHKRAYRRAGGDAAKAEAIMKDPPADLLAEIAKAKQERTFQNPNETAQAIINLRSKNKLFQVVIPFVNTPANIARLTWERSPAGFIKGYKAWGEWKAAVKSGADAAKVAELRGAAVDALARPLVGTTLMLGFGALAKAGGMTGQGPIDPKDKNALKDSGWQPYSFVIPGADGKKTYIPFNRFEPVSGILGFAADMVEAGDAKSANDFFAAGVGSLVQNLASKTYLQGLADAAGLIKDPMGAGASYATNLAGSLVPNIVSKVAQAVDPNVRDVKPTTGGFSALPERIANTIESRIPGLSQGLPARHGSLGEEVERPGHAVSRFLSPVQVSSDKSSAEMTRKLVDLDAVPTPAPKTISVKGKKIPLLDDEYAQLSAADQKATALIQRLMDSASFKKQPEEAQRQIVRNTYERLRGAARTQIVNTSNFRRRAREAKALGWPQ